ncbi:MAG: lipoprotein BA_5634 family protein [Bacilli bacterium]
MKNILKFVCALMLILPIAACSGSKENNALFIYGTKDAVNNAFEKVKDDSSATEALNYREVVGKDGKKTLVFKRTESEKLAKYGLFNEVVSEDEVTTYKELPAFVDDKPLYFGETERTEVMLGTETVPVTYGKNIVVGKKREYGNDMLVVSDARYDKMAEPERVLGLVTLKSENAKDHVAKVKEVKGVDSVQIGDRN